MGHPHAAAEIAIAKQVQMRRAGKVGGWVQRAMHRTYGTLARYGYRPMRTVWCLVAVWFLC